MPEFRQWMREHKKAVVLVVLIAVVVRVALFVVNLNAHGDDIMNIVDGVPNTYQALAAHDMNIAGDCYYETSANLLDGHGFSCELLPPYASYNYGVPLYPFFLALVLFLTHSYYALILIQIVLLALTCVLGMYVADLILPWAQGGLFVGIFLALEPSQVLIPLDFSPEVLFMPLFLVFLILFIRYLQTAGLRPLLWAAGVLGLATLIKPTTQYLPVLLILFVLWQARHTLSRRLGLHLAYFAGVFVLVLSPWVLYNYVQFGALSLSTQSVRNPYIALLPSVISLSTGVSFDEAQAKLFQYHPNNFTFANSAGMTKYTITQLARYPAADAEMIFLSALTFFTADDVATLYTNAGIQPSLHLNRPATLVLLTSPILAAKTAVAYIGSNVAPVLLARILFICVSIAFLVGLYAVYRTKQSDAAFNLAVLLIFYFMITTMSNGFGVTARFRMPVETLILAVAYAGFMFFYQKANAALNRELTRLDSSTA